MFKLVKIVCLAGLGLAGLFFALANDQDAARRPVRIPIQEWAPSAALNSARGEACAVALADGKIVVAGGSSADAVLTSVEIADPSGTFSSASSMLNPRANHACVALPDGTMLVAGGKTNGGGITNSAEVYDPDSNKWTAVGSMSSARHGATATPLKDGRVVIAGGQASGVASNTLEIYDPETARFTTVHATLSSPRTGHGAAALRDGRVLIAGGTDGRNALDTVEIFDPNSNSLSAAAHLSSPRAGLSATALLDGNVLLAGGNDGEKDLATAEVYDAATDRMGATISMLLARTGHKAINLPNNNTVVLIGGTSSGVPLSQVDVFVPWENQFRDGGSLGLGRTTGVAVAEPQTATVLVAGGISLGGVSRAAAKSSYATLVSDKKDYRPGETVHLTGSGWQPNETVQITLHVKPTTHPDVVLTPKADPKGDIAATYLVQQSDLGVTFYVTSLGLKSGRTAAVLIFWDGQLTVTVTGSGEVTSTPPTPALSPSPCLSSSGSCTATLSNGATVTLHASAPATWTIGGSGTTGSCAAGSLDCTFTNNGNSSATVGVNFNIAPTLTSISPNNGTYGTATGTISFTGINLTGVSQINFGSATVTPTSCTATSCTATFSAANMTQAVGAKSVTLTGPGGTSAARTFTINQRTLTVSASGVSKPYDGGTTATVTLSDDRVSGDAVTTAYTSASFGNKNVGTGKTVNVSGVSITGGASAGNYTLGNTTATTTADITARTLTVAANGVNKPYDGNTTATVTLSDNHLGSDVVTTSYTSASFATKTVGDGKTVNVSGISITGGVDAGNYTLGNTTATTTANITPRTLTVTVGSGEKPYDGNALATVGLSDNRVSGDAVTLSYTSATFANKNVGTGKTVTVSGISIAGGADAGNYTLGNTTATTTADITPRTLNVSATGVNKPYDGNTGATVTLSDNRVSGDAVTTSYGSASFATKTAGNGKTVSISGISITGGADAGNYSLGNTTATTTANITPRTLTVSATGVNKPYDGNTSATVTLSDDHLGSDVVTTSYSSASFATKSAGNGKTVNVSGISITGGADALNYTLGNTTATTTANITPRTLTVSATGVNKPYDGNTSATVTLSDDRVSGDALTTSYSSASFVTKTVGNGKTVSVSGISITGGGDAGNYTLGNTTATTTADITPRTLTVSATGVNKPYDGSTNATVTLSDDHLGSDAVTAGYSGASFATKTVGNGKTVSVSGISITGGADAGNYTLGNTTATTAANITPRTLTVTVGSGEKPYDGNTLATVALSDNRVSGDAVTTGYTSATFANKNVGTGKTVTVSGISIVGGPDAGNYTLGNTTATTTADITPRTLTVSATGVNKPYDGNTAATVTLSDDHLGSDAVTTSYSSAAFVNKNAGNGKTVNVSGISITGGADAGNYSLGNTTTTATANITPRTLNVTATGQNKPYDGGTGATVTFHDDRVSGDVLTVSDTTAFTDKNVGNGKTVNVSGISISGGADAGNYTLGNTTATTTADITPRTLTVSATGVNKPYDGNTTAAVTLSDDRLGSDLVTTSYSSASFVNKNAGNGKTVNVAGISITGGADAGNYSLGNTTATATANITPRTLNVTATGQNKPYDGKTSATVTFGDDRISGDVLTVGDTAAFIDRNVGTGKTVSVSGISITGGADAGNYLLGNTTATTTANITARTLTVTATGQNKPYDGNANATVTLSDNRVSGDAVTTGYSSALFNNPNVGTAKPVSVSGISITGGADGGNYTLGNTTASTSADITGGISLTAHVTASDKPYDGTATASITGCTLTGTTIPGDAVTCSVVGPSTFSDRHAGTGKTVTATVTLGGAQAGNYALASTTPTTTASIFQASVAASVTAQNKYYDGGTTAAITLCVVAPVYGVDSGNVGCLGPTSANFITANSGTGISVIASGITLTGNAAGDYTLTSGSAGTAADIMPKPVTATVTAQAKAWDGTNTATTTCTLAGVLPGEDVICSASPATFPSSNEGTYAVIYANPQTLGCAVLTGTACTTTYSNYALTSFTGVANASIVQRLDAITRIGQATLMWGAYNGAAPAPTSYTVYCFTDAGTTTPCAVPSQTATGTTALFTGLTSKTTYYFYMIPSNAGGAMPSLKTFTVSAKPM